MGGLGVVVRAAVPCIAVEDAHRTGGCAQIHFIRMWGEGVFDHILHTICSQVATGHDACGTIVRCHIIKHPHGVHHVVDTVATFTTPVSV